MHCLAHFESKSPTPEALPVRSVIGMTTKTNAINDSTAMLKSLMCIDMRAK